MYPKTFKKTCQKGMPRSQSGKICQEGIPKKKKKHVLKAWQGVRLARQVKSRSQNQSVKLLLPNTIVKKSRCWPTYFIVCCCFVSFFDWNASWSYSGKAYHSSGSKESSHTTRLTRFRVSKNNHHPNFSIPTAGPNSYTWLLTGCSKRPDALFWDYEITGWSTRAASSWFHHTHVSIRIKQWHVTIDWIPLGRIHWT